VSETVKHDRPVFADVEAWRAEAVRRFGDDPLQWRFVCPSCGHVASCADFKELGVDPGRAPHECIGRALREIGRADETYTGPESVIVGHDDEGEAIYESRGPARKDSGKPCDWAAFGLFGTLGRGSVVARPEGETWVFDFAEVEDGAAN
jgi:hypothetical protein